MGLAICEEEEAGRQEVGVREMGLEVGGKPDHTGPCGSSQFP